MTRVSDLCCCFRVCPVLFPVSGFRSLPSFPVPGDFRPLPPAWRCFVDVHAPSPPLPSTTTTSSPRSQCLCFSRRTFAAQLPFPLSSGCPPHTHTHTPHTLPLWASRYVYFPQFPQRSRGVYGGIYAARAGRWKVHWCLQGSLQCGADNPDTVCGPSQPYTVLHTPLLFDIELDASEQYPLAATDPDYPTGTVTSTLFRTISRIFQLSPAPTRRVNRLLYVTPMPVGRTGICNPMTCLVLPCMLGTPMACFRPRRCHRR